MCYSSCMREQFVKDLEGSPDTEERTPFAPYSSWTLSVVWQHEKDLDARACFRAAGTPTPQKA